MRQYVLAAAIILLLLGGCMDRGEKTIAGAMKEGGIGYSRIIHQHELKDAVIVFYERMGGGLDAGLVDKSGSRFKWGFGGGTVSTNEELQWGWVNLDHNSKQKRYQLYYGILNNDSVVRLHIEQKGDFSSINKDAQLIPTSAGYTIWFALQNSYSDVHPGFVLNGYSKDGERVLHFE